MPPACLMEVHACGYRRHRPAWWTLTLAAIESATSASGMPPVCLVDVHVCPYRNRQRERDATSLPGGRFPLAPIERASASGMPPACLWRRVPRSKAPARAGGSFLATSLNHRHSTELKLERDFVLHSLRHTMLTRLGEAGVDAFTIMGIAEDSSVTVSQKYVHPRQRR